MGRNYSPTAESKVRVDGRVEREGGGEETQAETEHQRQAELRASGKPAAQQIRNDAEELVEQEEECAWTAVQPSS